MPQNGSGSAAQHPEPTSEETYDWEMVIACGVALLLQSAWDGEPVRALLARATGTDTDIEALAELRAYVWKTLEPMR